MTSNADALSSGWVDVSVPLHDAMPHWPGNPDVRVGRHQAMERGDLSNVSALSLGAHTGTHVDAPLHFFVDGVGIEAMEPSATIGRARVIEIRDPEAVRPSELEAARITSGERILFKTRNSSYVWASDTFVQDFVGLSVEAARYLVDAGARTVGVDYLSVAAYGGDAAGVHRALLGAGVWIIEGLDLSVVSAGHYELICLPLRIVGSEGAPARAVLRPVAIEG